MRASRPNRRYQLALWIDRWFGPPLCALLFAARRLRSSVQARSLPESEQVQRILVLKMWGMGSIVLASPLLRRLREQYPAARIDFVTLSENKALLDLISDVDRRVILNLGGGIARFLASTMLTVWRLRGERYDLLFDLEFFTRFSAIFSALVNPARSHGFSAKGNWRGRLHDVEVPFNAYHHVALNFLTLLRRDPMAPVDDEEIRGETALPRLEVDEQSWQACCENLAAHPAWREGRPIVVVNPNAGDMALERRWPLERVSEFLRDLCGQRSVNAVVTGSPAEADYARSVVEASGVGDRIINLAGQIDIPAFVALLAHADAVVTNDSGPLHLAAAAGASTVALFGPETPRLYGPLLSQVGQRHDVHYLHLACSPCMFVHDNKVLSCWFAQARCMTGISPAKVLHSVSGLLSERESAGIADS